MSAPLHLVHRAEALPACLARLSAGSPLLLLDDAVHAALAAHRQAASLSGRTAFVLQDELAARGLAEMPLAAGVTAIGMTDVVALTIAHHPAISWF